MNDEKMYDFTKVNFLIKMRSFKAGLAFGMREHFTGVSISYIHFEIQNGFQRKNLLQDPLVENEFAQIYFCYTFQAKNTLIDRSQLARRYCNITLRLI